MTRAHRRRSMLDGRTPYFVHEGTPFNSHWNSLFTASWLSTGMLRMAEAMGSAGKPVHGAVAAALRRNRGYGELWSNV
jgi:hypothetical protein